MKPTASQFNDNRQLILYTEEETKQYKLHKHDVFYPIGTNEKGETVYCVKPYGQ